MTVKEFSKLIGIPSSKIRFYDRSGIIEGDRELLNNYRTFCESDVLSIYNAQMLRSFNFCIKDVLESKNEELAQIDTRLRSRIDELELSIREQEMRLVRLKEMTAYFTKIRESLSKVSYHPLEDSYNIFTVNCDSSEEERNAVMALAEVMPFSYVCIKISRESILNAQKVYEETGISDEPLKISLGLGILESNRKKIGLSFPPSIKMDRSGMKLGIFLECQDVLNLKLADISPVIDELKEKKIPLAEDLIGRVFISYSRNGNLVHGLGFGCIVPELS